MPGITSDLAGLAEEPRGIRAPQLHERAPAAPAGLALALVDLEVVRLPRRGVVDAVVVAARPRVLHRFLHGLDDGAIQAPDLLVSERIALAVPAQSRREEDLVAVDGTD